MHDKSNHIFFSLLFSTEGSIRHNKIDLILFYSKYCTSTAICKCTTYLRAVNFKGRISWHGWIFDAARKANWVALISLVRPRCKRAQASPLAARRMKYLSVGSSSRSKPDVCGLSWVVFVDVLNFFFFFFCAKLQKWVSIGFRHPILGLLANPIVQLYIHQEMWIYQFCRSVFLTFH